MQEILDIIFRYYIAMSVGTLITTAVFCALVAREYKARNPRTVFARGTFFEVFTAGLTLVIACLIPLLRIVLLLDCTIDGGGTMEDIIDELERRGPL